MRLTSLLFVVFSCILLVSGQCPGDDPSLQTWSSVFGGNTGAISITSAQKIKLDTSVTISSLTISGTLVFDDSKDLTLVSGQIRINTGGFLIIGSESCPYSMKANITLVGTDKNSVSLGTDPSDNGALGTKGIAVTTGGNLQLHGKLSLPSWTRLSATVAAGSSEITVEADVQWQVGDKIVIATTDYSPVYNTDTGEEYVPSQSEYHTIKSINGRTITLVNPVTFMHWGADYEKAEVGLLSRHIVLNGGAESVALQFGGHVIVRAAASAQISGVEFTSMGQLGVLGRYPLHFHLMRDQVGKGIYAKDNSFHHNFQRCVAIHDSNGILVQNNVAYNTIGHCYFLEDGGERKNTFDNNLGVLAKPGSLILSDNKPSIFWITNPDNTFTNNVAVEGTFGYWYSLPAQPVEASAATYANSDTVWPRYTPLLKFKDNVCHSQERNGLMVDEMVEPDQTTPLGSYLPSEGPYNQTFMYQSYRYIPVTAVFENTLAYKCRDHGIWTRGRSIHILNSVAVDNTNGILCVPGASLVENALIIGESENIGTPLKNWLPDFPRSRPVWWTNAMPILGIGNYDAGSPQFYRNITLKNFVSNSFRPAGGIFILPNGINMLFPSNKLEQFNFVNANEVYLENWPNDHCPAENDYCLLRDGPLGVNVNDLDGSVTGYVGGWIVGDTPMMLNPGCVHKPQWNGYACPPFQDAYVQLYVENTDTSSTNFGSSLTEHFRAAYYNLGWKTGDPYIHVTGGDVDETVRDRYAANLQTHRGYTLRFNHETPESLQLTIQGSAKNEWLVVALPYPSGTTFTITTSYENAPVTSVGSRDLVDKYHYHFDGSHLYVMIQNKYDSVSEFEGFSNHDGYSSYTKIKATCPGGNCGNGAWGDSPQPAIPAALNDPTSKFKALFLDSTCKTNSAFFSFNPNTYELSYTIYHALGKSAQKATLEGPSGTLILLDNAKSPIRGAVTLSRDKYVSLWNGEVSIKIATDSTSISGKIGCLGDCVAPNQIPVGDFCNAAGAIDLYTDSRNAKWDSWSWDDTFVSTLLFNSTEAYCGSHSVRMYWAASAGFVLHTGWQQVVTVDSSKYKYLQFFAKTSAVGSISDLLITLRINDDTDLPQLRVTKKYISNYVIEENWTRVRIPLADLGLTGTQSLSMVQINQFESWRESNYNVMYLDQLQIIGDEKDTLSTPLTGSGAAFAPENSEGCVIQTDYDTSAGSSSTNNGSSSTTDADSEEGSSATSIFVNLAIIVASIALLL